jgi:hypothetical protein
MMQSSLRRLAAIHLAVGLSSATAVPGSAARRTFDSVVAVVDGTAVTAQQLRVRAAGALRRIERTTKPGWERDEAERRALREALPAAIDARLFERALHGVTLGPREVDGELDRLAVEQHVSRDELLTTAFSQGYSRADVEFSLREQLVERWVLYLDWPREHDGPMPTDSDGRSAWRNEWLAARRAQAAIETRWAVEP